MSECDDDTIQRELPEIPGDDYLDVADPDISTLIEIPTTKYVLTARHETDVHTAITRGLANYLLTLEGAYAGRLCRLESVVPDWADHATGQRPLPSAAVYSAEEGRYVGGLGASKPVTIAGDGPELITVTNPDVYELESLRIEVMCPDKGLRVGIRQMLEQGLSPVAWNPGFRLVLPRYHNAIATFLLTGATFPDSEATAQQGLRPASFRLRVSCPRYQLHRLPLARPIVSGTIA